MFCKFDKKNLNNKKYICQTNLNNKKYISFQSQDPLTPM